MLLCSVGAPALVPDWQGLPSSETVFRVKRRTKMSRLLDTYAAKIGDKRTSIRALFDGERINDEDCPESVRGSPGLESALRRKGRGGRAVGEGRGAAAGYPVTPLSKVGMYSGMREAMFAPGPGSPGGGDLGVRRHCLWLTYSPIAVLRLACAPCPQPPGAAWFRERRPD